MDIKMWPRNNMGRFQAWKDVEPEKLNAVRRYFVLDTLTRAQFNRNSAESAITDAKRMNAEHARQRLEHQYESCSGRW